MSCGVSCNEDYADSNSDINRFSRATAFGTSLDDFSASLVREREPGTYYHYVSIDTQVLGMDSNGGCHLALKMNLLLRHL
jgi:hypothetical protein